VQGIVFGPASGKIVDAVLCLLDRAESRNPEAAIAHAVHCRWIALLVLAKPAQSRDEVTLGEAEHRLCDVALGKFRVLAGD
jgi:hypothetical protein